MGGLRGAKERLAPCELGKCVQTSCLWWFGIEEHGASQYGTFAENGVAFLE